ncbi:MAG: glycoside hydrolase family 127 protein, partial [Vicinamibacterales bacterium]
ATQRQPYFDVACCPANLARLMAQLPGLIYSQRRAPATEVFVNLFVASEADLDVGGTAVKVAQDTRYPWDGDVAISLTPATPRTFTLSVRVPGWSRGEAVPSDLYRDARPADGAGRPNDGNARPTATIGDEPVPMTLDHGFLKLTREWKTGDVVRIHLPMPVRRVLANPAVTDDTDRAVIERGPLVYSLEAADQAESPSALVLPLDAELTPAFRPDFLGGVEVITGGGVTAIPYFAWNNRGPGEMAVWIRYR